MLTFVSDSIIVFQLHNQSCVNKSVTNRVVTTLSIFSFSHKMTFCHTDNFNCLNIKAFDQLPTHASLAETANEWIFKLEEK